MRRVLPVLLVGIILLLTACGGQATPVPVAPIATTAAKNTPQPEPKGTSATADPTSTTLADAAVSTPMPQADGPQPGMITGKAVDAQGKPLTAVQVVMYGTTLAGSNTYFSTQVDETGHYMQPVPDGIYEITAYANVQYNDRTYNLWLHPVDGINTRSQSSVKGLVKDFEWLLSGTTPYAKTQPNSSSAYYGGTVGLGNNSQFEMSYGSGYVEEHEYPAGSKIVLEFTPTGPLMDGSEGKVLKYDIKPQDLRTKAVRDVPLGDYTVKATLVEKNGKSTPLPVASVIPGGPFGEKIEAVEEGRVEFVPSRMGDYGIEPMMLFVLPE